MAAKLDFENMYSITDNLFVLMDSDLYTVSSRDSSLSYSNFLDSNEPYLYFENDFFKLKESSVEIEEVFNDFILDNRNEIKNYLLKKVDVVDDGKDSLTLNEVEGYQDVKLIWNKIITPMTGVDKVNGNLGRSLFDRFSFEDIEGDLIDTLVEDFPDLLIYENSFWKFDNRRSTSNTKMFHKNIPNKGKSLGRGMNLGKFEKDIEDKIYSILDEKANELEEELPSREDVDKMLLENLSKCETSPYWVSYNGGLEELGYYKVDDNYYYILKKIDPYPIKWLNGKTYDFEGYTAAVPVKINDKSQLKIDLKYGNKSDFIGLVILGSDYEEIGGKDYVQPYVGKQWNEDKEIVPCIESSSENENLKSKLEDSDNIYDRVRHLLNTGTRAIENRPQEGKFPRWSPSKFEDHPKGPGVS